MIQSNSTFNKLNNRDFNLIVRNPGSCIGAARMKRRPFSWGKVLGVSWGILLLCGLPVLAAQPSAPAAARADQSGQTNREAVLRKLLDEAYQQAETQEDRQAESQGESQAEEPESPSAPGAGQAKPDQEPPPDTVQPGQVQEQQPAQPGQVTPFPQLPGVPSSAGQAAPGQDAQAAQLEGQQPGGEESLDPVEIRFQAMPLDQFLEIYAELVGRTILRPENLPNVTITLKAQTPLTRSEAVQAFNSVLALNGITMLNVGDKFVKAVQASQVMQEGAAFTTKPPEELPEAGKFITQIVQLEHVLPSEAIDAITPFAKNANGLVAIDSSQVLVLRDYSENVKRMMEVLDRIDVMVPTKIDSEVIPIKYAQAEDIAQVLGSLTAGGGVTSVGGAQSRGGGLGTTIGGGSQLGQQNQLGQQQSSGRSVSSRRSSFQQRLQQIVSRASSGGEFEILGEVQVIADRRTNSILVFANDQDMKMVKNIIDKLDVILSQVLIEAIVMEVSLSESYSMGVNISQNQHGGGSTQGAAISNNGVPFVNPDTISSMNSFTNVGSGFSYFARLSQDFDVALNAAATDGRVNILSRPRIQTSHAVPANFFVGETRPFITGTTFGGGFGDRSSYSQLRVGIELAVLPFINPDGLVVMQIDQTVQDLGPPVEIDGNPVPTTTERTASSEVAVRDQDTIILGGFISSNKSNTSSGVPVLKDIPLLGALFRSSRDSSERREMMVMIRPTVLETPEAAAVAASNEKERMPGIRQAEKEWRKEHERRIEEGDSSSLIR